MLEVLTELCARRALPVPAPRGRDGFFADYAAASRRAGKQALVLDADEQARLGAAGIDWPIATRADELVRMTLLLACDAGELVAIAGDCFRTGDNEERRALLRALPLFPQPERFVALAVDACRTNVVPIFEAIAAENPFPARHFPELHFHQLVLKAVFLGVRLPRVIGLGARVTPELARMADDYAAERRAAGRSVPEDLDLLVCRRDVA
jgi:hypothetical protein